MYIVGGQELIDREPAQSVMLVVGHDGNIDFKRQPMRQHNVVRTDAVSAREVVWIVVLVDANPALPRQRNGSPEFAPDDSMSVKVALIGLETLQLDAEWASTCPTDCSAHRNGSSGQRRQLPIAAAITQQYSLAGCVCSFMGEMNALTDVRAPQDP